MTDKEKSKGKSARDDAPTPVAYIVADDDNRFFANHTGGVEVSGPDDGEVVLTWEEFFGTPYPGAK